MKKHWWVAMGLVASTVGGCGISSVEWSFDDALIRKIGAGSVALQQMNATFDDAIQANKAFTGGKVERAMERLMSGQLNELSYEDIELLETTNARSRRQFNRVLRQLDGVKSDVRRAKVVDPGSKELTDGALEFIDRWNAYLAANADRVASIRSALVGLRSAFGQFDSLLLAARATARLGHTREFKPVRDRFMTSAVRGARRFERGVAADLQPNSSDRRLVDLLNGDEEASAIGRAVNDRYPGGWLATASREDE